MHDLLVTPGGTCTACSRRCDLRHRGSYCGVRHFEDGVLRVDAAITHAAVQRIEDKPLFHYTPGAHLLTLGSWGCGTRCCYCRNASSALARRPIASVLDSADVVPAARRVGVEGIAFSYNEPLVRAEQVYAVCAEARSAQLTTVIVTSGFATDEVVELLLPVVSAWRVDVKAATRRTSDLLLGVGAPWASVFLALRRLSRAGAHVEISLTYSPSIHDDGELERFADAIACTSGAATAVHLQPLLPAHRLRHMDPPSTAALVHARDVLTSSGLEWVYVHLLGDRVLRDTRCACGSTLVARSLSSVDVFLEADGRCNACGRRSPIVLS